MSVPDSVIKAFKKLGRSSTFVQFQTELFTHIEKENGNSEKFLQDFNELETNIERVDLLYEKLGKYNLLDGKFIPDEKNDRRASKHKEKGNKFFTTGKYVKALQFYNKSLTKARSEEILAAAYANRSATLFKLNLFEECVVDIDRAIAHNYPDNLKPNLMVRRAKAIQMTNVPWKFFEEPPEIPERHPEIPGVSNCLELNMDEKSKWRILATRDIEIGEVLAVETPLSFNITNAEFYHCHHCFNLCYNPIPCTKCSQTLYCGEQCRDEAFIKYHRDECSILHSLKNMVGKHKAFLLAIKMLLIRDANFDNEMTKLDQNMDTKNLNDELFTTALTAALMYNLVKKFTPKFDESPSDESEKTFKESLMTYLRICISHAAGIDELCPNENEDGTRPGNELLQFKSENVACGIYPFYGLLRHVCCPNVFAHHHGLNRVLRAFRSIKKGDECFVSYGPYYVEHGKEERQYRIQRQYHFTCDCRACEENWPQLDLKPYYITAQEDLVFVQEIRNANVDVARRAIPNKINQVKQLEHLEPDSNLTLQQKLLSYCYDILGNKRSIL